jgi:hypothetical protein
MRHVEIAEVVLDMWLAGFTWSDVAALEGFKKCDTVQQDALGHLWCRIEWANNQNNFWAGISVAHPCDVTRRAVKKSRKRNG